MIIKDSNPFSGPSFSFSNRLLRFAWGAVWLILFKPSPRIMHEYRSILLRLFGAKIGKNVHIYPNVKIWAPWNLQVDDYTGVADGVTLYNMDKIVIGSYCVISQGAHLCGGSHDYNSKNFQLFARPIIIKNRAWICAESFLFLGVTIEEGVVVGARSVVKKDCSIPWGVYAGNPCAKVGERKSFGDISETQQY